MSLLGIQFVASQGVAPPALPTTKAVAPPQTTSRSNDSAMSGGARDARDSRHHRHHHHHHHHCDSAAVSRDSPGSQWINESLERRLAAPPPFSRAATPALAHPPVRETESHARASGGPQQRMDWMSDSSHGLEESPAGAHVRRSAMLPSAVPAAKPGAVGELLESPLITAAATSAAPAPQAAANWRERVKSRVGQSAASALLPAVAAPLLQPACAEGSTPATTDLAPASRVSWKRLLPSVPAADADNANAEAAARGSASSESAEAGAASAVQQPAPPSSSDGALEAPRLGAVVPSAAAPVPAPPPVAAAPASVTPVDQLNRLHSAAMRAQLAGDTAKHAALLQQIAALTPQPQSAAGAGPQAFGPRAPPVASAGHKRPRDDGGNSAAATSSSSGATVILSTLDARGRPIPSLQAGPAPLERADLRGGRRQGKHGGHANLHAADAPTERADWTANDARDRGLSLAELVRREAQTPAGALDQTLARHISRAGTAWKHNKALQPGSRAGADEDDDGGTDDLARLAEDPDQRLTARAQQQKDKQRAVAAQHRHDATLASCPLCFESAAMKKHLVISLGEHSYLSLPPGGGRIPGQLRIVPFPHVAALTEADEDVYEEVNRFKGALHALFASQGRDVVFLETATELDRGRHTAVDVIPMDKEEGEDAPLFFRKAILDSEEWTTNKQLIDTAGKGLRRCVPKGFAYFHVAWRGGGFVHPIDDEGSFPAHFGIDTAAGMLGLPPSSFGRKEQRPQFDAERAAVLAFLKDWGPFDWTQQLEGGGGGSGNGRSEAAAGR